LDSKRTHMYMLKDCHQAYIHYMNTIYLTYNKYFINEE
jgi:hypothetical protein